MSVCFLISTHKSTFTMYLTAQSERPNRSQPKQHYRNTLANVQQVVRGKKER